MPSKRPESDPGSPEPSPAALASKEPESPTLPASPSTGQIPSEEYLVLAPGVGPAGQGSVTENGLRSVAAQPARHLPSAQRSKFPLPDPVLFLEPFTCHRSPEDSAVCYVSTAEL